MSFKKKTFQRKQGKKKSRRKLLVIVKETAKTLLRRIDNKWAGLKKIEDDD